MIFVTLGTQDKTFERLLNKIDELIKKGLIHDEVIVQAGHTKYKSDAMKVFDFIDMNQFNEYVQACSYMITHAGVGTIINGLSQNKPVIAVARRVKYGEHENDHQTEIVGKFDSLGYILGCLEVEDLEEAILKVENFKSNTFNQDNHKFCSLIESLIEE